MWDSIVGADNLFVNFVPQKFYTEPFDSCFVRLWEIWCLISLVLSPALSTELWSAARKTLNFKDSLHASNYLVYTWFL